MTSTHFSLFATKKTRQLLAATAILSFLLPGCASQVEQPQAHEEPQAEIPTRPFPPETLYALLISELSLNRERYDVALSNYVRQAHKTRDPGIAARATRIARFLNARKAALDTSLLWVQIEPSNFEARLIASTELATAGRLMEALEHGEELSRHKHDAPYYHIASHGVKATDTQRELLIQRFKELQQQFPEEQELQVGAVILLQQAQQLDEALSEVQRLLNANRDNIPAAIIEARILQQMKRPEKALERMVQMLRRHPENTRLRLQYARILASQDLDKAYDQFKILNEQNPEDADLLFSLALVSKERGMKEQAKEHFITLLQLGKRTSSAHYYLGRLLEDEGNTEAAIEHFYQVKPSQDFLPAIARATQLRIDQDNYASAHKHLNHLRETYPRQVDEFYLLEAKVLSRNKLFSQAYDALSEALSENPQSPDMLYTRAMIAEKMGDIDGLEEDLRQLLRYDPNNAIALNSLGYTLLIRTNRIDEAYELIQQALQLKPDEPAIIDSMGWILYRKGNYPAALARLEQAMSLYPDHEIAAHLGEVLWVLGEHTKAKEVWIRGLELKPDSPIIKEAMDRLGAAPEPSPTDTDTGTDTP